MNDLISLSKLFDKRIFRIPDYQRGYAWSDAQLIDFWDDLVNLTEDRYHYTGMLSLKKLDRTHYSSWKEEKWIIEEKGYDAYHVVDGQQRLTTFIILVSTILKFAHDKGIEYLNGDELEEIKNRYIIEYKKPQKILKAFKFGYEIDNPSFEYLRYNILEEEKAGNLIETFYTQNLERAKYFFIEKIEEFYDANKQEGLETLFRKLVNRMQFNIHDIDDDFDVFVAFETMNNRGKKLSNLEILKNRLIYLTTIYPNEMLSYDAKEQLRRDINDTWKEVYYQLGRNKFKRLNDDDYLKNHWTLYFKYTRNKGDDYIKYLLGQFFNPKAIYGLTRNVIDDYDSSFDDEHIPNDLKIDAMDGVLYPEEIKDYIDSLKYVAQYWYYSFNPSECNFFTKDEIKWLEKLNRIGIAYFRPLVVASFVNDQITSEQRVRLFKVIEKFIFLCFRLARYQSSYQSHIAYSYARELMKKERNVESVIDYFEDKFQVNITEAASTFLAKITNSFKQGKGYYDWYDLNYFLFEYEMYLSEKTFIVKMNDWSNFIKNEKDKISIEHIFPQTATRYYWRNEFRNYDKFEQACLANSLGNLLALSQSVNSSLQNDEYPQKREPSKRRTHGYSNGSNSEIEVAKYQDWNPDTILERGLHLLSFMEQRWCFTFNEDKKYELLGLEFMKNERENKPELPKEDYVGREIDSDDENSVKLVDYLKDKKDEIKDLYNSIYYSLIDRIPDIKEYPNSSYIALKCDDMPVLAEMWVQSSQIKIITHEPYLEKNKIGESLPESYNSTKMYVIRIKRISEKDKVVDALCDIYENVLRK